MTNHELAKALLSQPEMPIYYDNASDGIEPIEGVLREIMIADPGIRRQEYDKLSYDPHINSESYAKWRKHVATLPRVRISVIE